MSLLSGREVMAICRHFSPFSESGELKPENERATLLAANLVPPVDVISRGFVMAAAQGDQSPMLVQLSYSAINMAGGNPGSVKPLAGVSVSIDDHLVAGARIIRNVLDETAEQYGARFMGITLDHFRVPKFEEVLGTAGAACIAGRGARAANAGSELDIALARARIDDAVRAAGGVRGGPLGRATVEDCLRYLSSDQYAAFRQDFLAVVNEVRPAWGMIDTETLPPALTFAVTRDISDELRHVLGNTDMILEAEYGATGQSGDESEYERLAGTDLDRYARDIAAFVEYSGAEAIAYPAGMVHASKTHEKHEPDVDRLIAVHREVMRKTGRYVPYAQHGGTGAAFLPRGLVGKNNIATRFMVVGMNYLADYCEANVDGIREGSKSACNPGVFGRMSLAIAEAAVEKLKECGSFGRGPEVARALAAAGFGEPRRAPASKRGGAARSRTVPADSIE
ncbi:MAG: hypothetical protein HPY55_02015 [Firmicutes bacterium]|nr:hypothetical protein [Bacillota bacterium]